jgi:type I restriction enzyme S subunit
MRKILFKDLFDFAEKSSLQAGKGLNEGQYPFYTSSKTQSKYFNNYQFSGENLIFGTGGEPSIHFNNNKFAVSTDCLVARPNSETALFNPKFVFYYLQYNIAILEAGFRGAGLKHISKAYIANISIPLPEFGPQNQIVAVLDNATQILENGRKLDEYLDQLCISTYFSMFGDEVNSAWQTVNLSKLALDKRGSMRTGPFGSNLKHSEFTATGSVRVLGLDNVVTNNFGEGNVRFITMDKFNALKNYQIFPRDLLIALMGTGTTGKSAVVPDDIPLSINTKHLAAISLDPELANPYYVSYTVHKNQSVINQIALKNKGAVVPGINLTVVKGLKLKVPPISLQNKFEDILKCVEATKLKVHLRNEEIALLLEILKYISFTGQLKINIENFSFDDQMVEFLEKEQSAKKSLPKSDLLIAELKKLVFNKFNGKSFTFSQLEQAVNEAGKRIDYERIYPEDQDGLKDFVFHCLQEGENETLSFLNQKFVLDKNRDTEKKKDNSRIVFEINN